MEESNKNVLEKLEKTKVDILADFPELVKESEFLLEPCMHRGGLSCIYGKSGSGKSTAVAILIAKLLMANANTKIAYIDTMHGRQGTRALIERIIYVAGCSCADLKDRLFIFDISLQGISHSFELIGAVAMQYHPDVIFVDCMEDFVEGGYDAKVCSEFTRYLISISGKNDVHICAVMYTGLKHLIAPRWLGKCESKFRTLHEGNNGYIAYFGKDYADRYIKYNRVGAWGTPQIVEEMEGFPQGVRKKFPQA